jgi:hypothetical protein
MCPVCREFDEECFKKSFVAGRAVCSKQLELPLCMPSSGVPRIKQKEVYEPSALRY